MGTDTQCVMLTGLQARPGTVLHSVSGVVAQSWSGWVEASRRTLGTVTSRQTPRDTGEHTSRDTGAQLLSMGEGVMKNNVDSRCGKYLSPIYIYGTSQIIAGICQAAKKSLSLTTLASATLSLRAFSANGTFSWTFLAISAHSFASSTT